MKRKITIAISSFMLIGLCLLGLFFIGSSIKSEVPLLTPEDIIVQENENEYISFNRGIKRVKQNSSGYLEETITAVISPSYVVDNTLTWNLSWNGSQTATLSDYVTITVSEDTLSVTVTYKKAFPTQIVLTVTSNSNTAVKATCNIDCYKRSNSVTTSVAVDSELTYKEVFVDKVSLPNISNINVSRVGTVDSEYTQKITVCVDSDFGIALSNAGINMSGLPVDYVEGMSYYDLLDAFITDDLSDETVLEKVLPILNTASEIFYYNIMITDDLSLGAKSVNFTKYFCTFDMTDGLSASSVTLDKTQIIF